VTNAATRFSFNHDDDGDVNDDDNDDDDVEDEMNAVISHETLINVVVV